MLNSYKFELFMVTIVPFVSTFLIDFKDKNDSGNTLIDYNNLSNTKIDDVLIFFFVGYIISMLIAIFFHLFRIFKLRKINFSHQSNIRLFMLIFNVLSILLFSALLYLTDDTGFSIETQDLIAYVLFAFQAFSFIFYIIYFIKESRLVFIKHMQLEKSLIDELHQQ